MMLRVVCLALVAIAAAQEGGPLVETAYGTVRGTRHVDAAYSSFTGIRYAQAPTGRNRFGSALPPPSWQGIFEADRNDISCPQIQVDTFIGINDCLTINVHTPDVATPETPVAVIVYFYGGGFTTGSVTSFGHDFLIKHDVVVVLANFRINALGFLCLRHEHIPGNASLKDQVAALRWVQQNIRAFGGDPDNVTIMGHSAGAISIELLTLSPMAEGLFNRAIEGGGSALAFWAVDFDPIGHATTIAQAYLGYDGDSTEELVEFFLEIEDKALTFATEQFQSDLLNDHNMTLAVTPCVEQILPGIEAFLTDSPANIMKSGQYTPVPKLYVLANKEYVNGLLPSHIENVEHLMANLENLLPTDLVFQSDQQRTEIASRVHEFYVSNEKSILESYIDYMSDVMVYHSTTRAARERQSHSNEPIYMLEFTYESERRFPRLPETSGINAAGHLDDALYVVMITNFNLPISPEDQVTIDRYTTLLTNFAKYNNPTPDVNDLQWPPLSATQFPYLQLGSEVAILQSPNAAAMELWDQIYAELERPRVQTAQGLVRGTHHLEGRYSSFTGMRYAQAPTGRNRFGSASPPPSWPGIFEADRNDISCPQIQVDTFIGINDCLTINVHTPDVATPETPVAVIVYFYGGGFTTGSVTSFGHDFLIKHDVVVVLANFRINALGFLCLRHEHIPGNASLKDQVAALRWVQQNIRAFGGDPDNVTIMGHSAGAISIELLTLSPMAEGLFNRAIEGGGSALAFWAVDFDPIGHATTIAQAYLGYDGDSTEDLVEFFLEIEDKALTFATEQFQSDLLNDHNMTLAVTPCVEQILPGIEAFLTDSPANIMESGQYTPVPKLYVLANKEYVNGLLPSHIENVEHLMANLENLLPTDLVFQSDQQRTEIASRVHEFYVSNEKSILESYIDYMSDVMVYHSTTRAARERQSHSNEPIYMLEFTYESERRFPRLPETSGINAAGHLDDALYVVMITNFNLPISPEDQVTIDRYTTLLTNFAKYNNPTPDVNDLQWPPLSATQFPYLQLGSEVAILQSPNAAAMELWDQIYAELERPRVQTAQGLVRGTHHLEGRYSSFTGMRYAQAPTGRNRFGSASPPPSWQGIFEADRNDISCPQIQVDTFIGINDCLTINVHTPDVATPENPVAVIVYFYGGGFTMGSVTSFGHDFLIKHDVVVVLANFRINALGFLCLRHEHIPGNASLKDQVAALRWVQQNIRAFGGDPDNVTIMGHSAGAISIELLTLSPMAEGLFNRAIEGGGSALAFWAVDFDPIGHATTIAQAYLGYDGDSTEDLVEFFLEIDDEALTFATMQFQSDLLNDHNMTLAVTPCVEQILPGIEALLTDLPANIMESGLYTPVPKLYVVANKEHVNGLVPSEIENVEILMENLENRLPTNLVFQSDQQRAEIASRVREFYVSNEKSILESHVDYMSDVMIYHSITRAATERQSHSTEPIYMLEFTYESERRLPRLPETSEIHAAGHGDDALYAVMIADLDLPISPEDQVTIDRYTTLLTNFAKYNNPTPDVNDLQWPPLSATQFPYLQLGSEVAISQSPNAAAMELWDQIYAELERPRVQTAQGLVRGTHHLEGGYSSFTGMRYAQAPTGRNRFGSASPPPSWQGIFEADRNDIACPQIEVDTFIGINDCLTLNVYTPDVATPENPVTVIVYFYGGGFTTGSVILYGQDFLIKHDVVVVLVNFRINALGLLCLKHEHIPGNASFKDQVAALRWVQQNIRAFGGDPDNVTIMGHSGGAISVELLTLSPMAEGLFNRAIEGGGSALAFTVVDFDPVGHATTIAQAYLGYDGDSTEDLVEFFLEIDDEALTFATAQFLSDLLNDHNMTLAVLPCVEQILPGIEAFLTDSPADIMESGQYTPVPKLYVLANKEYVNMLVPSDIKNVEHLMANLENRLPTDLVFQSDQQRAEIASRVHEFYVSNGKSILESYVDYMSDVTIYHSTTRAARKRQSHSNEPIYMLEFTYESERRLPRLPETSGINAAGHLDDALYVVMIADLDLPISPEDQVTIDRYTTLLTNFAKYNDPTPQNDPIAWLPVSDEQLHYLELGSELRVSHSPNAAAIALWDEIYAAGTSARILPSLLAIFIPAFLVIFMLN